MVIRSRNKKGDVTISTVILIVLGLAVLVMMIIGFTKGWSFLFGWFDNSPSELQQLAKVCALYAQGSLSIDFCSYRLIGDEIVNCRDSRIIDSLKAEGVNVGLDILKCADPNNEKAIDACKSLIADEDKRKGTMINDANGKPRTCSSLIGDPSVQRKPGDPQLEVPGSPTG